MALRLRSANKDLMREINASIVLGLVREHGQISRAEIARIANLSAATVTGIASSLIRQELVVEESTGISTGGRRPILLAFNCRAGVALGVKITERKLVCVATNLGGEEQDEHTIPLPEHATPTLVVELIATEVARLRQLFPGQRFVGVGVGIAGVVDRPTGVCRFSPFLRWRNVPLRDALEAAIGAPVVVENDVNTLTFAFHEEAIGGADSSIAIVTVGRGVGLGMMIHGHPFRGARGRGGEFGHITVDPDGPLCECGKRGCLEAIVSLPALLRDAGAVLGQPVKEHELRRFVDSGHDRLSPVLDRAAAIFGGALATLVNILNPDMVVLSGEGSWFVEQMLPTITRSLDAQVFDGLAGEFALRVDQRGDDFWAKGAAGMLLEETFRPQLERVRHNGMTLSASGKR